jgi:hypothetical protein
LARTISPDNDCVYGNDKGGVWCRDVFVPNPKLRFMEPCVHKSNSPLGVVVSPSQDTNCTNSSEIRNLDRASSNVHGISSIPNGASINVYATDSIGDVIFGALEATIALYLEHLAFELEQLAFGMERVPLVMAREPLVMQHSSMEMECFAWFMKRASWFMGREPLVMEHYALILPPIAF